jgi:hypothetical protein
MSKSSSTNVNIPSNYDIQLGGDGSTIRSDTGLDLAVTQPIVTQSTSTSDSTAKLDLKIEPMDLKIEPMDIKIEPLKVESDSHSTIDVKPLAVDSCQTLKLAPLPPIRIEQPYSQHFAFTYMGMELWGFTVSGKSEMFLHSPSSHQHHSMHAPEIPAPGKNPAWNGSPTRSRGGLRVRIGDKG